MEKQDKEWIKGMVNCDDYANDIIKYIEDLEKRLKLKNGKQRRQRAVV